MAITGTLTTMSVSDLLQFLAAGRKTGTLKFTRGKIVKEIYFRNGTVIGANTNDPNEYLGQVLLHYGKITEPQLQTGMEEQRRSGGKLGEILAQKGFLTMESVLEILRIRTLDLIYDLFIWEEAHFEFFDQEPLPPDLITIEVEPTTIIMEGIYRVDELSRFRTLIPSDRAVLELASGWTASLSVSKEVRQILYLIGKNMTVAEICYNMHDSSFNVHAKLFDLISNGIVKVVDEQPLMGVEAPKEAPIEEPKEPPKAPAQEPQKPAAKATPKEAAKAAPKQKETPKEATAASVPEDTTELLWMVRRDLKDEKSESALATLQQILTREPKNFEAQALLQQAETLFIKQVYSQFPPNSVPEILVSAESLTGHQIGPQEAFVLSRINGEWDIQSILSICPFREADSLRMMKALLDSGVIGINSAGSKPYHT